MCEVISFKQKFLLATTQGQEQCCLYANAAKILGDERECLKHEKDECCETRLMERERERKKQKYRNKYKHLHPYQIIISNSISKVETFLGNFIISVIS